MLGEQDVDPESKNKMMISRTIQVLIIFMMFANSVGSLCCTESKRINLSNTTSENQTDRQLYSVAFYDISPEHRNRVLAIKGIQYVEDGISSEGYPAIIISADAAAIEEIRKLDFVHAVVRAEIWTDTMPKFSRLDIFILTVSRFTIPITAAVILILLISVIIFVKKKRRSPH